MITKTVVPVIKLKSKGWESRFLISKTKRCFRKISIPDLLSIRNENYLNGKTVMSVEKYIPMVGDIVLFSSIDKTWYIEERNGNM
jgi:signal peptidase I